MLGLLLTGLAIYQFIFTRNYYCSLLIFFGLITNGFQLIPASILMAASPVDKLTDLALLYIVVLLFYRFDTLQNVIRREGVFKWVAAFVIFVLADAFYSCVVLDYSFSGVLKVLRANLFLLSFGVFFIVPTHVLIRVMRTVCAITVVLCVIFLIQIPLKTSFLAAQAAGSEAITHDIEGFGFTRFYNTPVYLTPVFFYYLFVHQFRSKMMQVSVVGILVLTVVAPMHRSYIITLFFVIVLYVLVTQRNKRTMYLSAISVVAYLVSLIDVVSYRINEAFTDLGRTLSGSMVLGQMDYSDNTLTFRIAHLLERFQYIMSLPLGWLFGIGLLGEDTKQANKLPFEVGIFQERYDRVAQIETGDIPWSMLLLQVGLVGAIFYTIVLVMLAKHFYKRKATLYSVAGLLWVTEALLASMLGVEMILIPFRVFMLFIAVIATKASGTIPSIVFPAEPPVQKTNYSSFETIPV
ncbi:hypothetical protein [Spirosoma agri]|uniref:O-antigen ligase family protein n=1 Tax=Spirosoma agri TaxID=1987381 RepID=A0A6M0ILX5_9BACT|nr:hypothetical protein [Spirosoma agri]NEU69330.1 hypothetical protein [Spirosoma agri]